MYLYNVSIYFQKYVWKQLFYIFNLVLIKNVAYL